MRIQQLYCNFGYHFAQAMAKKYNLNLRITNIKNTEPLLMFGCYNYTQASIALHHAMLGNLIVIIWAGSDSLMLRRTEEEFQGHIVNYSWAERFKEYKNLKHIAISHWIADDLKAVGLDYKVLPVTPHDYSDIKPCPLGDSIYMYQPENPNYNGGIYQQIKERLPEYNFIEAKFGTYEREEILELYKKCFIGLRFTEHDGLSNTVCEMGMLGRRVINNGSVPNCIAYDKNDINEIISIIKFDYEFRTRPDITEIISKGVRDYLNIGDDFLNTEYYE